MYGKHIKCLEVGGVQGQLVPQYRDGRVQSAGWNFYYNTSHVCLWWEHKVLVHKKVEKHEYIQQHTDDPMK